MQILFLSTSIFLEYLRTTNELNQFQLNGRVNNRKYEILRIKI